VLVNMNQDSLPTPDSRDAESDNSSASPGASSELRGDLSSAETTPPPLSDETGDQDKQFRVNSPSAFSRSLQSIPSSSFTGSAPPYSPAFSHFRQSSVDTRPSTAEAGTADEDDADLAAAIRLCSFGTPRSKPVVLASDVPPVPPLPARYLSQSAGRNLHADGSRGGVSSTCASASTIFNSYSLDPSHSYKVSDERDVKMADADCGSRHRGNDDVDFGTREAHADDDDDGVFGRMEE
jgi:hypothetical protein